MTYRNFLSFDIQQKPNKSLLGIKRRDSVNIMYVIFIHGPVAAGKYTIGNLLSELTGLPLFHNHLAVDTALALFSFGSESFRKMRANIWVNAFSLAAESSSSFIFTFHPETTVEPSLIDTLTEAVTSKGGQVLFVELTCSRAATLQRLANEGRAKFKKLTDSELFARIEHEGGFDFPPLPKPLVSIDTERVNPETAAQLIADAIRGSDDV
jgi:hypothetical protein